MKKGCGSLSRKRGPLPSSFASAASRQSCGGPCTKRKFSAGVGAGAAVVRWEDRHGGRFVRRLHPVAAGSVGRAGLKSARRADSRQGLADDSTQPAAERGESRRRGGRGFSHCPSSTRRRTTMIPLACDSARSSATRLDRPRLGLPAGSWEMRARTRNS
jgi:hypothetical protein